MRFCLYPQTYVSAAWIVKGRSRPLPAEGGIRPAVYGRLCAPPFLPPFSSRRHRRRDGKGGGTWRQCACDPRAASRGRLPPSAGNDHEWPSGFDAPCPDFRAIKTHSNRSDYRYFLGCRRCRGATGAGMRLRGRGWHRAGGTVLRRKRVICRGRGRLGASGSRPSEVTRHRQIEV